MEPSTTIEEKPAGGIVASSKRVASRLLRVLAIIGIVCLAPFLIVAGWLFWIVAYIFCSISVIVSPRRSIFRYEEQHDDHAQCGDHAEHA